MSVTSVDTAKLQGVKHPAGNASCRLDRQPLPSMSGGAIWTGLASRSWTPRSALVTHRSHPRRWAGAHRGGGGRGDSPTARATRLHGRGVGGERRQAQQQRTHTVVSQVEPSAEAVAAGQDLDARVQRVSEGSLARSGVVEVATQGGAVTTDLAAIGQLSSAP